MRRLCSIIALCLVAASALLIGGCSESSGSDIPDPTNLPQETERASVYYSTGRTVIEEQGIFDAADLYGQVFEEFIAARPELNADIAVVQPEATINSVEFADGELTIDWGRDVLDFEADDSEKTLVLAAILLNAGQFPEITTVRFTVEGQTEGEIDGKDVQYFWGRVSLVGQPFDVIRPPEPPDETQGGASTTESGESPSDAGTTTTTQ